MRDLIDTDERRFTREELLAWRRRAEEFALELIRGGEASNEFDERDRLVAELFWPIPSRFMAVTRFILFEFRQLGEIPIEIDAVFRVNQGLAEQPRFHKLTADIARAALALHSMNRQTTASWGVPRRHLRAARR